MHGMWSRRVFVGAAAALAAGTARAAKTELDQPAILGGKPLRTQPFPSWPVVERNDEKKLLETLRSKLWNRRGGSRTAGFEQSWAAKLGAGHAVATNGGTTALYAALAALDVGPKDEVIVPPYTFIATVNAVLQHHALPVFVDTDFETHQIDASKIEAAITKSTRVILPVHIAGSAADMDAILAIGKKHRIPVLEDACQAHLGEWRGRKLGTLGAVGCFSFQASKNLNCGEGGCLVTNDAELAVRASAFHNNGNPMHGDGKNRGYGSNLRMTELQAALLESQMERLDEQAARRSANAAYLDELLAEVPGIAPARLHEGCTRSAYHLYMLRYEPAAFAGMAKARLIEAVKAEGIPLSGGYSPLNHDPFLDRAFQTRAFRAIYSPDELRAWGERNVSPVNDRLCGEAFWLGQTTLLSDRTAMERSPTPSGRCSATPARSAGPDRRSPRNVGGAGAKARLPRQRSSGDPSRGTAHRALRAERDRDKQVAQPRHQPTPNAPAIQREIRPHSAAITAVATAIFRNPAQSLRPSASRLGAHRQKQQQELSVVTSAVDSASPACPQPS